ncbi:diguanylate cyclase [uncultured Paraglaciecola sp.]|uniref:GGDEF domain-containing protein n=1 Tax=uncultured Paraglaciecola sp. TaxID=1765024 RepID=UPI00260B164C|nr:diguanylate cyclase [uncultured Paraglaciecola sp.]
MTEAVEKRARISLVTVFSIGLASVLFVFVLLSYFSFTRLLSFESTLTFVSNKSMPKLIQIGQLYSQATSLIESKQLLSRSSSFASKRLAEQQLQENLNSTRKASKDILANEFLDTQLNTIAFELDEFSTLIEERIQTFDSIALVEAQMYELNLQATIIEKHSPSTWILGFSQALVNVSRVLNEDKLQRVRFLFLQLKKQLVELRASAANQQNNDKRQRLTTQLEALLFAEDGLQALKIKALRLAGRTLGRENFVHNLIVDYVAQMEFVTKETEQNITLKVASSVKEMKQQTQLMEYLLAGGVVILIITVILFQQRVLKRIRIFNLIVRNKTQGFEYKTMLDGNDEITDLAAAFKEFTQTIDLQKRELKKLSMADGLTGIANRRALDIRLRHDIELCSRQKSHVSILLMDIDCFKLYNDNYGHIAGDQCLKNVSKIITDSLPRESDFVARYGGEEFVCVLPNTDSQGAIKIATHIIAQMKHNALPHKYSNVADYVTMSIGIASSNPTILLDQETIIKHADNALYQAKENGKNSWLLYS